MNILLNNYCNLNCSYCFANDVMGKQKINMNRENFEVIVNWLKQAGENNIRFIGGEPTLHPNFAYFVCKIANDPHFKAMHIFSNAVFNENILQTILLASSSKRVTLLPNCNEQEIIGKKNYNTLLYNIENLAKKRIVEVVGINIYKPNMNYKYIFDIANRFNIPSIRWSIAVPNVEIANEFDIKEYYKSFIPLLKNFFKDSVKYRKNIRLDCNSIPLCLLEDTDLREMVYCSAINLVNRSCGTVLDVSPNLDVVRCFGLSREYSTKLTNFKNVQELSNHMHDKFKDLYTVKLFEECKDCTIYKRNNNQSCGCHAYKLHKYQGVK
ncbi:radical SAM protein [Clostridium sp. 'deep sea']|uniref:radical SAM protein n=1 Tax=Clostridium sp. 'deep sea' TaxID=2779445 RepID=UPI0018968011|nr:radical SAM protein [Clostridium sp. 'deep sea']QOR33934.1 radical SAM protein [Clostridium sp. 'deep sea']